MIKILSVAILTLPLCLNSTYLESTFKNTEIRCLAANIYHEARGEPALGQLAVAKVTLNRAEKEGSICSAVFRKYQFSWTIKTKNLKHDDYSAKIAMKAIKNDHALKDFSATHYHANYVKPNWAFKYKRLTRIGNHIFYEKR